MTQESLLFGIGSVLIGVAGLWNRGWLLAETPKGRFLVEAVGPGRARVLITAFFTILVGMGVLLASGWLKPIRW